MAISVPTIASEGHLIANFASSALAVIELIGIAKSIAIDTEQTAVFSTDFFITHTLLSLIHIDV